ncbi:MAG: glycerophosphodiester phosphodiesterase [Anaerolineaceae bacterium]|nr:MAG: glycerophosphodiester phosphodiesterase [Anaerolineaceae bacterium]
MLADLPSPLILCHRGAKNYAPENTLSAFRAALELGADGFELDTQLTSDGHVVVSHDTTVDRLTNGHGKLCDFSLAELCELDAGSSFSEKFRGEKIPTLEEVFAEIGKRAIINIELKNFSTPFDDLVEKVCELVRRHGLQKNVIFSSFLPWNLKKAGRLLPEVPRGLITIKGRWGVWGRSFGFSFGDYTALHPHLSDVTAQQVQRVHKLKRKINVWVVNREEDIRRLIGWGVDGILTDDPLLAIRIARGSSA